MARTHRNHLSPGKLSARGGVKERRVHAVTKTHKQRRPNERVRLRKEHS